MSSLNGRKVKYAQLHGTIFIGGQNLPAKLLAQPGATPGCGYTMTIQDGTLLATSPKNVEFIVPLTQVMAAELFPETK